MSDGFDPYRKKSDHPVHARHGVETDTRRGQEELGRPSGRRRPDASPWHWLLLIPVIVPLVVPIYNRVEPQLLGLPFFYWCQLAFAGLSAVVVAIVYLATKDR
jgi:hypothetical protein